MKCPTIDKLSQYVDDLLIGQEFDDLHAHVKSCGECQRVVETFTGEQKFLIETFQTPTLPDDFDSLVLDQLEPYEQKRKPRKVWKRMMVTAAGMMLAVGVSAAVNPSFAAWIGGIFSTEQVDEGLRMAADAELAERVNLEIADNGLTFKVEDIIADSSRVVMSYQVLDKKGEPIDSAPLDLGYNNDENKIMLVDQNGTVFGWNSIQWPEGSTYGLIEFSLREQEASKNLTMKLDIGELHGIKGNWQLEIPIDLTKSKELTTIVSLNDMKTSEHGVAVNMKEVRFASSSTELFYETGFTKEEQKKIEGSIRMLAEKYGEGNVFFISHIFG